MPEVAIIGAGELGGALAHRLACRDSVSSICLVDDKGQIAAGKALDIMQAAAVESFSTRVSGAPDVVAGAGAMVFVLADRAGGGEWQGDDGVTMIGRILRLAAAPVILCAGTAQRELVERGVRALGLGRGSIFGSAPEALASAVRAIVALEANGSPRDVALTVLGVPPGRIVVPWEEVTIGGFAATRVLDASARRRIAARVDHLWPPGPYALAAAATLAIDAMVGRSRRRISAFVAPDDASGRRHRTSALPVRLGPEGIVAVEEPSLSARDRVALDGARAL
jgi:malate dehydrogenase